MKSLLRFSFSFLCFSRFCSLRYNSSKIRGIIYKGAHWLIRVFSCWIGIWFSTSTLPVEGPRRLRRVTYLIVIEEEWAWWGKSHRLSRQWDSLWTSKDRRWHLFDGRCILRKRLKGTSLSFLWPPLILETRWTFAKIAHEKGPRQKVALSSFSVRARERQGMIGYSHTTTNENP